jgi:hypothetical protein
MAEELFYLAGLLYCHAPMRPETSRQGRLYRCGVCSDMIDALSAEVEVWELATNQRPGLGFWGTPYEERAARLRDVLRWARLLKTGRYLLRWHSAPGRP